MLQALRPNPRRANVARGTSLPFPVGGWTTASPLADMDPKFALVMDNVFPQKAYGELRRGFRLLTSTGLTTPIKALMNYNAGDPANDRLFAATDGKIVDVGSGTATVDVSGLTSDAFQHVNFPTAGGHFLVAVNGADDVQNYDGSAWSTPTITGVSGASLFNLEVYKHRLWFCERNSLKVWYLPVDSISGAAASFNLGSLFSAGGYLQAIGTWTIDGGDGADDKIVFVSSKGQVAIFAGDDPADANSWAHQGTYNIAEPIGPRCIMKVAGDIAILTTSGVIPLSSALIRNQNVRDISLSANIFEIITDVALRYRNNFGWGMMIYPRGHMGIVNIPLDEFRTSHQYVVNVLSGAWCRFIGQDAVCWSVWKERLFFGGNNGNVYEADSGPSDGGKSIIADVKPAFNYFGTRGRLKRFTMVRPMIESDGRSAPSLILNTDFQDVLPGSVSGSTGLGGPKWDLAKWDEVKWSMERQFSTDWRAIQGVGYCATVRVRIMANAAGTIPIVMRIYSFDYQYEVGALAG